MSKNAKGLKTKKTMRDNKARRKDMAIGVYQLKVDESHLSKTRRAELEKAFLQAKWLYNSVISKGIFTYDYAAKNVDVLAFNKETGKCDITENRALNLGSQIKQAIVDRAQQNVINLSKLKKTGNDIGKLKFKKEVGCIPLKQAGVTFKIRRKTVHIQGIGELKVNGLEQLGGKEIAFANLIKEASGFFIKVTCYKKKEIRDKEGSIGIDMGIKDTLVFSDGRKIKVAIETPKRIKRLQKNLARKRKVAKKQKRAFASKKYIKEKIALQKAFEKLSHQKDDVANKIVNSLKNYALVAIQDENLSGWQKGLFGKRVQESILGRIKTRIKRLETTKVINRFLPTTKFGPVSLKNLIVKLSDRTFKDGWYEEDRDIKAAKMILAFALYNPNLRLEELKLMSVEELAAMIERFFNFSLQAESVETESHLGFFGKVGNDFLLEATAL